MARGRRGEAPAVQQAKGNPGRRRSQVQQRIEQAERLAEQLATVPVEGGDALTPPEFLNDPRMKPALGIWREIGPELKRTSRLAPHHRLLFAMFCVYTAEWLDAQLDISAKGAIQTVTTTVGGQMERIRPIVQFREIAYRNALDLGHHFGLTPREEYALFRDQADAFARNPGLFGHRPQDNPQSEPDREGTADTAAVPSSSSLAGMLDSLDSPPPGQRPN